MANKKISELNKKESPSDSATLVGVDNGETVQIPISYFQQNLSDDIEFRVTELENTRASETYVADEISATLGTILATLNRI